MSNDEAAGKGHAHARARDGENAKDECCPNLSTKKEDIDAIRARWRGMERGKYFGAAQDVAFLLAALEAATARAEEAEARAQAAEEVCKAAQALADVALTHVPPLRGLLTTRTAKVVFKQLVAWRRARRTP